MNAKSWVKGVGWLFVFGIFVVCFWLSPLDVSASSRFQSVPPPVNDNFENATVIEDFPFEDWVSIGGATLESNEQLNCYMVKSVWYRITPSADAVLQASMAGSDVYDPEFSVWKGTDLGSLSSVACGGSNAINFKVTAGQTYYIQAGRYFDDPWGELHISVEQLLPPPNDNFAAAEQITALPFRKSHEPVAATVETGEPLPSCASDFFGRTVWYAYTPSSNGSIYAYLAAGYSPVLAVYTGTALDRLQEVACAGMYLGRVLLQVQGGTTYYFQVGTFPDYGNIIEFLLDNAGPPLASFSANPQDPSLLDTVSFCDQSYDPYGGYIQTRAWNFGDGATGTEPCATHRYAADGNYTVALTITTADGRTAVATMALKVKTQDVAITKFNVPNSASAGQTRSIVVGLNSRRYEENVSVQLLKSNPVDPFTPWLTVGTLNQTVPVRSANRTTDFNFSYTFTKDDAILGKVTFRAIATVISGRDALPADNEAIAPPTKVSGGKSIKASAAEEMTDEVLLFLPVVAGN